MTETEPADLNATLAVIRREFQGPPEAHPAPAPITSRSRSGISPERAAELARRRARRGITP